MIPERILFASLLANQAAIIAALTYLPTLPEQQRKHLSELQAKTIKIVDSLSKEWDPRP